MSKLRDELGAEVMEPATRPSATARKSRFRSRPVPVRCHRPSPPPRDDHWDGFFVRLRAAWCIVFHGYCERNEVVLNEANAACLVEHDLKASRGTGD
jgi:hypothetical protein